mmetsp:Transcript_31697/g.69314  ORF Transcript_31697/g.69314 Transcript_31697/m.69314 type:complete len:204 (-) Transcript_31697:388-999(-)
MASYLHLEARPVICVESTMLSKRLAGCLRRSQTVTIRSAMRLAATAWRPLCSLTLRYSRSSASDPRASPRSSCTRRGSSAPGSTPRLTQSGKHSYNRRARARPARGYTNNGPDQKFRPTDRLQLGRGSYFKASQRMKAMVPKGVVIAHLYQRLIDAGPTSRGNASTAAAIYECDVTTVDPFSASLCSLHGQTFSSRPYRLSFC